MLNYLFTGLLAASAANARTTGVSRSRSTGRAAPRGGNSGSSSSDGLNDSNTADTVTIQSSASCTVTVNVQQENQGHNAFADLIIDTFQFFCEGHVDPAEDSDTLFDYASAIANVIITARADCSTSGNAWACASVWAGADAFAFATFDVYAEAIAQVDFSSCSCGANVFASADAFANTFGHVISEVSNQVDLSVCIEDDDEVDIEIVRNCLTSAIVKLTYGAVASVWADSDCSIDDPAICDNCCAATTGDSACECDQCIEHININADAFATAFTDAELVGSTAICDTTTTDLLTGVSDHVREFLDDEEFITFITSGPAEATCTAIGDSTAYSSAVNGFARATANAVEHRCRGNMEDMMRDVMDEATAFVEVYQTAYATCTNSGPNSGGCALAESFGSAFAAACVEASARAVAELDLSDCACPGDIETFTSAYTAEVERIFAAVEQTVGAEACVDDHVNFDESSISRRCVVNTLARATATAVASTWVRGSCSTIPAKCVRKCRGLTGATRRECRRRCVQWSEVSAELKVEALTSIDIDNYDYCSGDAFGDFWFSDSREGGIEEALGEALQRGEVQATIRWFGDTDVDIRVTTPNGNTIVYFDPEFDGGQLEFDNIPDFGDDGFQVENVFFPAGAALSGDYVVTATVFSFNSEISEDVTIVLKIAGQDEITLAVTLTEEGVASAPVTGTL